MQNDQFMMLPVNNVLKDLMSNNDLFINLALSFAGSGVHPHVLCSDPVMRAKKLAGHELFLRPGINIC
jgi:hypothetical protein